jgi:hypothetical protein
MAEYLPTKAPTEVVQRRWTVPVDPDDSPASASLSASGVTIDADSFEGDELVLTLSGGTDAATGSIVATITTDQDRVLVETLYIPIAVSTSAGQTVRDVVGFAEEAEDARERLEDMLRTWRETGADIAAPDTLTLETVLYCPNSVLSAVKNNLILQVADLYEIAPGPMVVENARRGLQLVKTRNLAGKTASAAVYY